MGILFLFTGRPVEGIILLVYEAVVVASIDNIVRAVTGSKDTKLNSTLSLISLAGGVLVFGIIGIILGPISFVVTKELLDIYKNNKY
jgi:predicted PurR-regulated permease PerM